MRLVETSGKGKSTIARDLGISDSALCKWCKELGMNGEQAFPGKGHQTALDEQLITFAAVMAVERRQKGGWSAASF